MVSIRGEGSHLKRWTSLTTYVNMNVLVNLSSLCVYTLVYLVEKEIPVHCTFTDKGSCCDMVILLMP